jgi:hypothetical protein
MTPKIEEFIAYVLSFYGDDGIYPVGAERDDVILALGMRIAGRTDLPFDGDSTDREIVRDIMLENNPFLDTAWNNQRRARPSLAK